MGVTVILGGQAGSEGKGKFAGYLAMRGEFDAAVCNFMPNAGHTWVSRDGEKVMVQQLPQAVVNPEVELFISAGSAIDPTIFHREINKYVLANSAPVWIHPRAMVVTEQHAEQEKAVLNSISSTLKGCGAATSEKIWRTNPDCLAKDNSFLWPYVADDFTERLHRAARSGSVLVEAPQGFDLDINHGIEYPYCTSRQTTTSQVLADAGLPPQCVEDVIAVIRPFPIRVGNAYDKDGKLLGTSGSYGDKDEITWEEVARRAGAPKGVFSEYTTVTGKLRRVFELDIDRVRLMCQVNGVTQIALNFANYIDWAVYGATTEEQLTPKVRDFIAFVEEQTVVPVAFVGTGPRDHEIVDRRRYHGFIGD